MDEKVSAGRLREARVYLGFSVEQAAERLGCAPMLLEAIEAGTADPGPEVLAKFGRLYMRPVEWFTGGWRFEPGPGLLRMAESVRHPDDREAALDFAEFLQCKKETETHG
jgi:transcriptional regulator with XRE-family HTH domain